MAVENTGTQADADAVKALQCGHGYMAVENRVRTTDPPPASALQCGHGYMAVENIDSPGGSSYGVEASMRPRLHGRGEQAEAPCGRASASRFNAATATWPWRTVLCADGVFTGIMASMRPRLHGRGERSAARAGPCT